MKTTIAIICLIASVCWADDPAQLYVRAPATLLSVSSLRPWSVQIQCGKGFVRIDADTGSVTYENCTPDEGAKAFWQAVTAMRGETPTLVCRAGTEFWNKTKTEGYRLKVDVSNKMEFNRSANYEPLGNASGPKPNSERPDYVDPWGCGA